MAIGIVGIMEKKASLEEFEREEQEMREYRERFANDGITPTDLVENSAVETELVEAERTNSELERYDEAVEESNNSFRSMESLIESLEYFSKTDGIGLDGAVFLNHALESNFHRFGATIDEDDYVSLEDFTYSTELFGRKKKAKPAEEAKADSKKTVKDSIRKARDKFREFLKRAWAFIKEILYKVTGGVKSHIANFKKLSKRALAIKEMTKLDSRPSLATLTEDQNKRYAQRLNINGKAVSIKDAAKAIRDATIDFNKGDVLDRTLKNVDGLVKGAEKLKGDIGKVKNLKDKDPDVHISKGRHNLFSKAYGRLDEAFENLGKEDIFGRNKDYSDGNKEYFVRRLRTVFQKGNQGKYSWYNKSFPGGWMLVSHTGGGGIVSGRLEPPKVSFGFVRVFSGEGLFLDEKKDIPKSKGEIVSICDLILESTGKAVDLTQKVNTTITNLRDKIDKMTSLFMKAGNDEDTDVVLERKIYTATSSMVSSLSSPLGKMLTHIARVNKDVLDVCLLTLGDA